MDETIDPTSPIPFLDVPTLMELSEPKPRVNWLWYGGMTFLFLTIGSSFTAAKSPELRPLVQGFSLLLLLLMMIGMMFAMMFAVRQHRAAQQAVEAIEELIKLRRWDQAATALQIFLSQPTRSPKFRNQALVYLSALLARYHRFEDAITVQSHLLESDTLDGATDYDLRLGRAMAMLHEDNLLDADRAISDLRKRSNDQSGGLALVEIYRDIQTGHPAEAIEIFNEKLLLIRRQLGHRVADAYVLVAKAYDLLGRPDEAAGAYEKATLLSPVGELNRRYPEVTGLMEKYSPAAAPGEAA